MDTIKSSREIDELFRTGRRVRRSTVTVLCAPVPEGCSPGGRVVFVAGKRLGNAVLRNRSKRVLRAASRRNRCPCKGLDIALIATPRTARASAEDLDRDLSGALIEAGVVR